MTPEQFCYWLQGFAEMTDEPPHEHQWDAIMSHLDSVFKKETKPNKRIESKTIEAVLEKIEGQMKDDVVFVHPWNEPSTRIC